MSSQWQQVQQLFHEAEALPEPQRASFLDHRCGPDSELHRQVAALLKASDGSDDFLGDTLREAAVDVLDRPQQRIGAYRVERPLGHGGMGSVYLAVRADDQYRKQVAIKVVRNGGGSPDLLRRFVAERQILADLNHPGIAQLLDGGVTDDGAPYLVMEYCAGQAIDEHCRHLPIHQRLRLFQEVCEAVAHAHRHLVVHCDLKPNNIHVTLEGRSKLLDFGTAKLFQPFESPAQVTRAAERFLTPEYASPEQIRGGPVTTAADIYSLGVILHELLTGQRLNRLNGKTATECERHICEVEPKPPSAECAALSGDLDSVVLKALSKEPARRYESVSRFSEDIERHLTGRPVHARPSSLFYYAGKFIGRNRVAVGGGALLLLTLAAGVVATGVAERRAVAAQERAQANLEQMLAAANTSLFAIHDSIADLPGSTKSREMVVRNVLAYLEPLRKQNSANPTLQLKLAEAYERLSEIQFRDGPGYLGDSSGAMESASAALKLREGLGSLDAGAADLVRMGSIERMRGNLDASKALCKRAILLYEASSESYPNQRHLPSRLALAYDNLSQSERLSGDPAAALLHIEKAAEIQQQILRETPNATAALRDFEQTSIHKCRLLQGQNKLAGALASCEQALKIADDLDHRSPGNRQFETDVASASSELGNAYLEHDSAQALRKYQRSFAIVEHLSAADPADARMRRSVAIHGTNMSVALAKLGRLAPAEEGLRKAAAIHETLSRLDPRSSLAPDDLAYTETRLGALLLTENRTAEAADRVLHAIHVREELLKRDATNIDWRFRLARSWATLADIRRKQANCDEAAASYRKSETLLRELEGKRDVAQELKRVTTSLEGCRTKSN